MIKGFSYYVSTNIVVRFAYLLGKGVPKKVATAVVVKMFFAPFATNVPKKGYVSEYPRGYIPPLLRQGVAPVPSTQRSVSDTKLCQGLDARIAVHHNMNPPL